LQSLQQAHGTAQATLVALSDNISGASSSAQDRLLPLFENAQRDMAAQTQARQTEFESQRRVAEMILALQTKIETVGNVIQSLSDDAVFDVAVGGENTTETVTKTLDSIVNEKVAMLQVIYQLRADTSLVSGASMAQTQTRDLGVRSILLDVGSAGLAGMRTHLTTLKEAGFAVFDADAFDTAITVFERASVCISGWR
jgi:methyl-accepting chemotaxis protein